LKGTIETEKNLLLVSSGEILQRVGGEDSGINCWVVVGFVELGVLVIKSCGV
jgi:hypothetical protein